MGAAIIVAAAIYVFAAFTLPNPLVRIFLRCLPVVPVAIWTLWFDRSRPLEHRPRVVRAAGRIGLLVLVMLFALLLLGLGLNWLYDPSRVA